VNTDGSLELVSGYPVATKDWVLTPMNDGKRMFGSNGPDIFTYSVSSSGTLTETSCINAIAHNPKSDAGVSQILLDPKNQTLYSQQISLGGFDASYLFFKINSTGKLRYIGTTGDEILWEFRPGLVLDAADKFGYRITCFKFSQDFSGWQRDPSGSLSRFDVVLPEPAVSTEYCGFLMSNSPTAEYSVIGFGDYWDHTSVTQLAAYAINSDGSLSHAPGAMTSTDMQFADDVSFDPSGKYLAVAGENHINVYQFSPDSPMALVSSAPVAPPDNLEVNLSWDATGHLYALTGSGHLYIYAVHDGVLTPAPGSPVQAWQFAVTTTQ
jgi:hypothetical protein